MRSPDTNYKGLRFLTVLAFVIVVCVIAVAQNGDGDPNKMEVTITQPVDQTTLEHVQTTLQQRMLKPISVDCINTPIEDVIRMMGEQANVDIIKSPSVTGNVTAKLTNVPLIEALDNILAVHGYGSVIDRNMVRIAPVDEIAQKGEILDNRVYRITYADVAEVENALKKFISKRGSISSNPGTSNIIVTDTSSTIKAIDTFIDEIDRITPQVMVEVRIYDIQTTEGFDLSPDWSLGRNNPITESSKVDTFNEVLKTSTTNVNTKTTATSWQDSDAGTASGVENYAYRKSNPYVGGTFDVDAGGTIRIGLLDSVNAEITLALLSKNVGAKLLANPHILVLDNEVADFEIVSEIPYTEQSDTSAGGSLTSVKFKEVGTKLKVTPHVTRGGMIRLQIVPEFGVVTEKGSKAAATPLGTVPTVDTRRIDTKALVRDGQSVVIGGLRKRTVNQTIKKVPFLGDVPVMGSMFSDISEETVTSELLIFITPRIVIEPTLSPDELKCFKATEFGDPKITYTGAEKADNKAAKKPEED
ncbi:MAG: secretin N-terminal domain-containing protein [Phycisphaerae bacterium]|nr:secretin N-terminal domain-containing protein [Phycisphaerae bacterium]MDD5380345.1 secretin N-terminal domain-containing protein [Phycisphaerae bacterium]